MVDRPPRPFLTAAWRYLVMLNYEVDPAVVRPYVPAGTELDLWEDRALVSVVGFRFLNTRVRGVPVPGHRNFDEINLRCYVRRRLEAGTWRRGVTFIKEIVPRRAVAAVARTLFGEPYVRRPMRHRLRVAGALRGGVGDVRYAWRHRRRWHTIAIRVSGSPAPPAAGSEAEFITEHSWGYTGHDRRPTTEYRVEHPRWRVWPARVAKLDCDVEAEYGAAFVPSLTAPPRSAFLAVGSTVTVYSARELLHP